MIEDERTADRWDPKAQRFRTFLFRKVNGQWRPVGEVDGLGRRTHDPDAWACFEGAA